MLTAQQTVAALGHSFGAWTTTKAATAAAEGQKTRVCTLCGAEEYETIPKLAYNVNGLIVDKQGEVYFFKDGVKATGWQKVGGRDVYFSVGTGRMMSYPAATIGGVNCLFETFVWNGMTLWARV